MAGSFNLWNMKVIGRVNARIMIISLNNGNSFIKGFYHRAYREKQKTEKIYLMLEEMASKLWGG